MYKFKQIFSFSKNFKNRVFDMLTFVFPRWVNLINFFFLRKTSTFIKSKYSKNRQWSKSIVYFGLWFGVICAFTFTYYNYRFLFTLSYIWWVPTIVVLSLVITLTRRYISFFNISFFNIFF